MIKAIELVRSKRGADGRWPLETSYPGRMPVKLDDGVGLPSRWITLRALRVLQWFENRDTRPQIAGRLRQTGLNT